MLRILIAIANGVCSQRRSGARPPPAPLPVKRETKSGLASGKESKTSGENKVSSKPKEAAPTSGEQVTRIGAPSLLKRESSDLFKSFAKTKPKAVKPEAKTSEDGKLEFSFEYLANVDQCL